MLGQNVKMLPITTPKDIYDALKNPKEEFRKRVCEELEISEPTFWRKLKENTWSKLELEAMDFIIRSMYPLIDQSKL